MFTILIKLKRTPDEVVKKNIVIIDEEDPNYSFKLGLPPTPARNENMYHRYLKYKNGDEKEIVISGYIFSDFNAKGEPVGWKSQNYAEFRTDMFSKADDTN